MENTQEEIWKDILELNSLYQVSNKGNIRVKKRIVNSPMIKCGYRILTAKLIKTQDNHKGYKKVTISLNGKKNTFMAHRLVAKCFIENPLNKEQVNHKNGIKDDNRVENLEWCTGSENVRHAMKTGLNKNIGVGNYNSRLTNEQVLKIREMAAQGVRQFKIAEQIGVVHKQTIGEIIKRRAWKHI
jgi:hypothetical protein